MLPELLAACCRLNVSLVDDSEGGYAFVDNTIQGNLRPWDVLSKLKTSYLNCVNGVAFQNEQIGECVRRVSSPQRSDANDAVVVAGILVKDLKAHRDKLAILKAKCALAREYASLCSTPEGPSSEDGNSAMTTTGNAHDTE